MTNGVDIVSALPEPPNLIGFEPPVAPTTSTGTDETPDGSSVPPEPIEIDAVGSDG
jgi:hypothetical protein